MPSPFPGMNPYLEHPEIWPGVHHLLISEIVKFLSPKLRPKYRVAVEVRMYETPSENSLLVGIPDLIVKRSSTATTTTTNVAVAAPTTQPTKVTVPVPEIIKEGYLEIREVGTDKVITSIEILSPANKRTGKGRQIYEKKRLRVLGSGTHLVEIDLLRAGEALSFFGNNISSQYRILISRGNCRPNADLYAFNLQNVIPAFPLPLQTEDIEPIIDLQALLGEIYEIASYDLAIDYSRGSIPPLSESDVAWADALLKEKGLR
ncbi:MAG: DUF4058 family protein [Coleofasciculaceae cyanobacterium]